MPVIVATKELRYAGKTMLADVSFEASEKDAKLLVKIGKARLSDAGKPKSVDLPKEVMSRAPVKETKVETAEPVEVKAEESVEEAPKRHYRRRDMSADQD